VKGRTRGRTITFSPLRREPYATLALVLTRKVSSSRFEFTSRILIAGSSGEEAKEQGKLRGTFRPRNIESENARAECAAQFSPGSPPVYRNKNRQAQARNRARLLAAIPPSPIDSRDCSRILTDLFIIRGRGLVICDRDFIGNRAIRGLHWRAVFEINRYREIRSRDAKSRARIFRKHVISPFISYRSHFALYARIMRRASPRRWGAALQPRGLLGRGATKRAADPADENPSKHRLKCARHDACN